MMKNSVENIDGFDFECQYTDQIVRRHCREFFPNGYGISIIRHETFDKNAYFKFLSYGNDEKPYEIGFLIGNEENYELFKPNGFEDSVVGFLDAQQVKEYVELVERW